MMLALSVLCIAAPVGPPAAPIPVILDTDIGSDVDDCFAVATAVLDPRLDVLAITTVHDPDGVRGRLVRKLLVSLNRLDIPVFTGRTSPGGSPHYSYGSWAEDHTWYPPEETAPEAIVRLANERPGELTLVAIGPQRNVAEALRLDPTAARKLKSFVCMAGSYKIGYDGAPEPHAEWNITQDIEAAQVVFDSALPTTMVGLDVCGQAIPSATQMAELESSRNLGHRTLAALARTYGDAGGPYPPVLFDAVAVLQAADPSTCATERVPILVDDQGFTRPAGDERPHLVCVSTDQSAIVDEVWRIYGLGG